MIKIFFGSPGVGKTTAAVRDLKKLHQSNAYDYYYTNFDTSLSFARKCNLGGLGAWSFPANSVVFIDEAGIEYNNRKFKTLPQTTIEWFKLHRHYGVDVYIYSQDYQDMDITLRRLATEYWHIRRLGPFTLARQIRKFVHIDEERHDIVDGFEFRSFWLRFLPFPFHRKTWYFVFRPFHYKHFDSFERPNTKVNYFGEPLAAEDIDHSTPLQRLCRIGISALTGLLQRGRALLVASNPPSNDGDQTDVEE